MKVEKISERDLKALLALGMILVAAFAYYLGFLVLLDSARTIKLENMQLETRLAELKEKDRNKQKIIEETEEYHAKMEEIVAKYPSKVTTEKVIYDLDKLQSNLGKMCYNSVTLEMNSLFYPVTENVTDAETTEATTQESSVQGYTDGVITVYKSRITANVENLSYAALNPRRHPPEPAGKDHAALPGRKAFHSDRHRRGLPWHRRGRCGLRHQF